MPHTVHTGCGVGLGRCLRAIRSSSVLGSYCCVVSEPLIAALLTGGYRLRCKAAWDKERSPTRRNSIMSRGVGELRPKLKLRFDSRAARIENCFDRFVGSSDAEQLGKCGPTYGALPSILPTYLLSTDSLRRPQVVRDGHHSSCFYG